MGSVCFRAVSAVLMALVVLGSGADGGLPTHLGSSDEPRTRQIVCLDTEGRPLENATVLLQVDDVGPIILGSTNSEGYVYVTDSTLSGYRDVEVIWRNLTVYRQNISVDNETIRIYCEVYYLTIRVNLLGLVPSRHAIVSIVHEDSGVLVDRYEGALDLPYGFYMLSAERTFRLPRGNYIVIVESLNSEEQVLTLDGNRAVDFKHVASLESALVLALIFVAASSFACFLVVARKSAASN